MQLILYSVGKDSLQSSSIRPVVARAFTGYLKLCPPGTAADVFAWLKLIFKVEASLSSPN
jgi:hypothetical protein